MKELLRGRFRSPMHTFWRTMFSGQLSTVLSMFLKPWRTNRSISETTSLTPFSSTSGGIKLEPSPLVFFIFTFEVPFCFWKRKQRIGNLIRISDINLILTCDGIQDNIIDFVRPLCSTDISSRSVLLHSSSSSPFQCICSYIHRQLSFLKILSRDHTIRLEH